MCTCPLCHSRANSPCRSTSLHMTARTSGSSRRASRARPTPRCSAPLAIKPRGSNCLLMGMRVIGRLFLPGDVLALRYAYSARVVIYDLKKDVHFTIAEDWDRSPDSIIVSSSHSYLSYFCPANFILVLPFFCPHIRPYW